MHACLRSWAHRHKQRLALHVLYRLQAQPAVDASKVVVSGFCYGGGAAVRYAASHPGSVAGVVIFYGEPTGPLRAGVCVCVHACPAMLGAARYLAS